MQHFNTPNIRTLQTENKYNRGKITDSFVSRKGPIVSSSRERPLFTTKPNSAVDAYAGKYINI